jgi:hypothetical protein
MQLYFYLITFIFCYQYTNNSLKNFLHSIKIEKYNNDISILKDNNNLIVYNGFNSISIYNENFYKTFNFKGQDNYNLVKITCNQEYIVLAFNKNYPKLIILNKTTGQITDLYINETEPIYNCLITPNNKIIIVDIFNNMICYNLNKKVLWKQKYSFSKIYNNFNEKLLFSNNKIYWLFDTTSLYIIDPNTGNVQSNNIILKNQSSIIDFILYENKIILITNNGVFFYNSLSENLEQVIENIYPISKGIIHNNKLYVHDNKNLFIIDFNNFNVNKIFIKSINENFLLLDPIIFQDYIIIPTKIARWYILKNNKFIQQEQWEIWSYTSPCVYNNYLIYFKNFSNTYFDCLDLQDFLKKIKLEN